MKVGDRLDITIERMADDGGYLYNIIENGDLIESGCLTATMTIAKVMAKMTQEVVD